MSNRFLAKLLLAALVLAGLSFATPASAATTPAWEPDPNSNGLLTFYDASGKIVTGGSNLDHLFDYAAGATETKRATTKASLLFAFPNHSIADTADWYSAGRTAATAFPNSAAPSPLNGFGKRPVAGVAANEANVNALIGNGQIDQTDGYKNVLQVRLYDIGPGVPEETSFWSADISFDTATKSWTQIYPAPVATETATALTISPASPVEAGTTETLTANVTPAAAAGTVTFKDGATAIGSPVAVSNGVATTTTTLSSGTHSLTATFTPTDTSTYAPSTSTTRTYTVNAGATDDTTVSISTPKSSPYGKAFAVSTTVTNARTSAGVASAPVQLFRKAAGQTTYTLAKTVTTNSAGAASFSLVGTANTIFQWRFAATATQNAANSALAATTVTQIVSVARTPATFKRGGSVKLYGAVSPAVVGQTVYFQSFVNNKWTTQLATKIAKQKMPDGRTYVGYLFTAKLTKPGAYGFRSYAPPTSTLGGTVSAPLPVRVT